MEEYLNKRKYLNHLKQISAIKNGQHKFVITQNKSRGDLLHSLRQKFSSISKNTLSKFSLTKRSTQPFLNRNKSTQQIMRDFIVQKENLRLVERIGGINSELDMKKYQRDYIKNKKLIKIHSKIKKPKDYFKFKVFDVRFQEHAVDPDEIFSLYKVVKQKKRFITQGTIFQLRKQEIQTSKNQLHLLKIQGKNWGLVELTMSCFLPILRHEQEVGNLIIEIV